MSDVTQSVFKAGKVLECLFEDNFQGKTINEIWDKTGVDPQSARRSLLTWKELGWVFDTPVSGEKSVRWMVSEKLVRISFQYKRQALADVHGIENSYLDVSQERLHD
ncbi:MAG: hypothetical protein RPU14_03875 [Candidatus Sedimenticola sp. (ex Thyasira tokunagai)]